MDRGSLGERLRAVRKARDLSQEALAREAGVSLNLVNKLERGVVTDPHYSTLSGIAGALGVSLAELIEEPVLAEKAEAPPLSGPLVNEDRLLASELASDTPGEERRETAARGAALDRYKRLQHRLLDIKELERDEQQAIFDESARLSKDLLLSDLDNALTDSERREQSLVLDVLQQTIWHILTLWELGRERGEVGADATNIEEAKADVTDIEEHRRARSRRSA
jgi:transcriptional regulator with XRE-family HTH domain